MEPLKPDVLLLHNTPAEGADPSEAGVLTEVADVRQALLASGFRVEARGVGRANLFRTLEEAAARRDGAVVVNLCEGLDGEARHEPLVAGLLELHGVRFTGSRAQALTCGLDKRLAKAVLFAAGIPTPGGRVFRRVPELDQVRDMAFPLVVKPVHEDASLGITADAFARSPEELCARVEFVLDRFDQPALGEVYVEGREFNVAVVGEGRGAQVLPVSEIVFEGYAPGEPRLVTHDAKWRAGSADDRRTRPVCPADVGEHLKVALSTAAVAAFRALECRDYARVDLRLDARDKPQVLEVNPNPDLSRTAGLARAVMASGDQYDDFVARLAGWAWARS